MTQESTKMKSAPHSAEKSIPGPVVVVGVGVFVIAFPLLAFVIERYAKYIGERDGLRPGYSAYRDPQQWLLSLGIFVGCIIFAWALGRLLRNR
jgi:hypothetical protein